MKSTTKTVQAEPFTFSKKIGSTVYRVTAHYNQKSKETVEDKICRLLASEARNLA
jgi:adenylosuccinate lyase